MAPACSHNLRRPQASARRVALGACRERRPSFAAAGILAGSHYAYRLTSKGVQVALLFLFFHKRLCGPLANSRFRHHPDPQHRPHSRLEAAYHRADKAIENVVQLLAAA